MSDNEQILKDLKQSVETWDQSLMESSVKQALNAKIPFDVIISEGLGKGMETINDMFNEAKIFLPQIMAASKTMQSALMMIEPTLVDDKDIYRGTIIMGSVQGDIHEIGKNVCCAMLRGAGYKVYDLGSDVPPDLFVEEAQKNDADIIGGSALMTTSGNAEEYSQVCEGTELHCDDDLRWCPLQSGMGGQHRWGRLLCFRI